LQRTKTLLNERGEWHPDAIEQQLGHVEGNDVHRAYVHGEHWAERGRMMACWSDRLDSPKTEGKVVARRLSRFGNRGAARVSAG